MFRIIGKLRQLLEDPRYPSLAPNICLLSVTGQWHPILNRTARFKLALFYITVMFFCSQYLKCLINFNPDSIQLLLQYAPFHMGIVKTCFFQKQYRNWSSVIEYMSSMERHQIAKKSVDIDRILQGYVKKSRRVTYFFWGFAVFSNFSIFTEPYQKNQVVENGTSIYLHMFDGYTPFEREPPGYYCAMLIQTVLGNVISAYIVGWDMLVVSIMILFAGQLKISRFYCTIMVNPKNPLETQKNIAECHRFHTELIKYHKIFNDLISPVMLVYLLVISVNLGVCIMQIVKLQDDLAAFISSCVYVVACLVQLLLFYWYSNDVTEESLLLSYSTFESDWTEMDSKIQKEIALLALTTSKRLVFKAGPFNEMSLSTFVAILKTSYSFYTILNETN